MVNRSEIAACSAGQSDTETSKLIRDSLAKYLQCRSYIYIVGIYIYLLYNSGAKLAEKRDQQ